VPWTVVVLPHESRRRASPCFYIFRKYLSGCHLWTSFTMVFRHGGCLRRMIAAWLGLDASGRRTICPCPHVTHGHISWEKNKKLNKKETRDTMVGADCGSMHCARHDCTGPVFRCRRQGLILSPGTLWAVVVHRIFNARLLVTRDAVCTDAVVNIPPPGTRLAADVRPAARGCTQCLDV